MQDQRYESNYMFPRRMLFFRANRSALLVRGLVFFLMGLFWLFRPVSGLAVLTVILGVFLLIDAMGALFLSIACRLFVGVLRSVLLCAAGIAMIVRPVEADKLIVLILGFWLIVTGLGVFLSAQLSPNRFFLLISGIFSILIGALLVAAPFVGIAAVSSLVAVLFLLSGAEMLLLGWKFRSDDLLADKRRGGGKTP